MAGLGGKKNTSWKTGQSGNPKGRPLNALSIAMREMLASKHYITIDKKRRKLTENEIWIQMLRQQARVGNLKAMEMAWDRGFGKPVQAVELDGKLETDSRVELSIDKVHGIMQNEMRKQAVRAQKKQDANHNHKKKTTNNTKAKKPRTKNS